MVENFKLTKLALAGLTAWGLASSVFAEPELNARQLYADNCAGCHQAGRVGNRFIPPLVKERLGDLTNDTVSMMIKTGIANTIMPPWAGRLSDKEISAIALLIRTESADKLDWTLDDSKASLKVMVDEKTLPNKPVYSANPLDLMAVMQRGRHAQAPESRVVFFDGATNKKVGEVPTARAPHMFRYNPVNPRWAYARTDVGELYKIDLYTMQAVRRVKTAQSGPFFDITWDGKWIATGGIIPGNITILNADTLEPVKEFRITGDNPTGGQLRGGPVGGSYSSIVRALTPNGGMFAVAARFTGEVWLIEPNKPGMPVTKLNTHLPTDVTQNAYLYDGFTSEDMRYIFISDRRPNNKIIAIDGETKKIVSQFPAGCSPLVGSGSVLYRKDGSKLYFGSNGGYLDDVDGDCSTKNYKDYVVTAFDENFKLFKQIKVPANSSSIAIHPNAPYIAVGGNAGKDMMFIDKEKLEYVKSVDVGYDTNYPEYTRDGKYLYINSSSGGDRLKIYDSKTLKQVAEYRIPAPAGIFAHARVLWGLKGAKERPIGSFANYPLKDN